MRGSLKKNLIAVSLIILLVAMKTWDIGLGIQSQQHNI